MQVEEISAGTNVNGQGNATPEREVGLVVEPYIQAASNSSPAQSGIRVFGNGASSVSFLHNENYPPGVCVCVCVCVCVFAIVLQYVSF